jgi:hypothetical protein
MRVGFPDAQKPGAGANGPCKREYSPERSLNEQYEGQQSLHASGNHPGPPEDLGSLVGKNRQFKTSESKIPRGNTRVCG